jgi:hypothetical protein
METKTAIETRLATSPAILGTLASFGAALAGRKIRPRTIETYHKVVTAFSAWLGDEATIADVSAESIGLVHQGKAQRRRSDARSGVAEKDRADPARLEAARNAAP